MHLRPLSHAWLLLLMLVLSACSTVRALNALVPDSSYMLHADIAYGELPQQRLDVYVPRQLPAGSNPPVLVFFYGGSWDSGRKQDYKFVAEAFASRGYVTVLPDYRLYPEVLFPGLMADPAQAAAWALRHAAEYGADPGRVFLVGHSAGAHIAAMLALDPQYLQAAGQRPADFRAMIGLAGPYDFLPLKSDKLKAIFGPEAQRWKSQPINFVRGDNPPMLLLVGNKDDIVWPRNTYHLADKIRATGGEVEVAKFETYGHIDMVAKLAKPLRGDGELLQAISAFVSKH